MTPTYNVSKVYKELCDRLVEKMDRGDEEATRIIAAMALLVEGWRYGDPDPPEFPDNDDDGEPVPIDLFERIMRPRAAA